MTKILPCICKHKYQDEKYGKNRRVFNYCAKKKNWRCTVCKAEQTIG